MRRRKTNGYSICEVSRCAVQNGDQFRCGWAPFPSFSRRGGCASIRRPPSLAAQTGWLVISNKKNKVRFAGIYKEPTRPFNHPAVGF
jgi:hypothetical protein